MQTSSESKGRDVRRQPTVFLQNKNAKWIPPIVEIYVGKRSRPLSLYPSQESNPQLEMEEKTLGKHYRCC